MRLPNATGQWGWWRLSSKVPMEDIRAHPNLPWDRYGLSQNKDITVALMNHLEQVMTNATGKWDWWHLSMHVPMNDIRLHPDLLWNPKGLSLNPDVTLDDVVRLGVEWYDLSYIISMDMIRARPDLPWNREGLSWNEDITVEAMNYLDQVMTNAVGEWEWQILSIRIPIEDIRAHPDLPWNREGLSQNKEMTLALMDELNEVLTNAVGEWDWYELSQYIPMDEIRVRPDLPWDPVGLALNPGVTVDDVLYMNVTGDIEDRIDSVVSMNEIKANPLWSWNKQWLSINPEITMEMVIANPDD